MKVKKNSLKVKIWLYLAIFSIVILAFLWFFQIIFLDKFYERTKVKELNNTMNLITESYNTNTLFSNVDNYAQEKGICIQVVINNTIAYDSSSFNKGCIPQDDYYRDLFINSIEDRQTYKIINKKFNNEVLIKAIKLNTNTYAFLSSSLQPLDNAVDILQHQLIIVTFIVLFLSFIIGYFISKKISNPSLKINEEAKFLASDEYQKIELKEDISELNELVKTLNDTYIELSKTENLRRELLANVGHDLKTPLTMIKAYAEMVRDLTYKVPEKREANLNVIIEESDRLNMLVNDIVLLSTIKSDTTELNITDFNLVDLTSSIIKRFGIMNVNFIFKEKGTMMVKADILRIEQVIYNLITNAINYTGADHNVTIEFEELEKTIKVSIIDTGKGIEEEELKLIWKKYYKVDKQYRREKTGSGIGLSIVEGILLKHNFKYGVVSKKNKGTTFWFEISKA
ncbi:MAG: HAMP domain-containing sensor histidine kinase [Bacilli bacterium]